MEFLKGLGEFIATIAGFMLVWYLYPHFLNLEDMVQMNNISYRLKQFFWSVLGAFISLFFAVAYLKGGIINFG
jgi:hypothetical protein